MEYYRHTPASLIRSPKRISRMGILLLIGILTGISTSTRATKNPEPPQPKVLTSPKAKAIWEPIFFEAINARAHQSNLPPLRSYVVPRGDVEVRIWKGFGLSPLEGIVLKRAKGIWSGVYLHAALDGFQATQFKRALSKPQAGWSTVWDSLQKEGLLTLPDHTELKNDGIGVLDGTSFVVEINREGTYRTYCYDNPKYHKRLEDQKMLVIVGIVWDQFNIDRICREVNGSAKARSSP